MLSSLLFRQMFQKHSDTDVYPLTSVEEELKRIGEKMATAATTLKPEFSSQKDVKHKVKQASFLTPLVSQSSPKGLERSDKVPGQFFISLQMVFKCFSVSGYCFSYKA